MESFFKSKDCDPLNLFPDAFNMGENINDLRRFLKLFFLLYADDTILFSENAEGLQKALNCLEDYCNIWKLQVNTSKTKITIFSTNNRKKKDPPVFKMNDETIEIVDSYIYLGIEFFKNGKFFKARKRACDQAQKAMFALLKKCRTHNLPIDLQLQLFDTAVMPVLLYGAEVWGYEDNKIIETIQLKFLKYIMSLKKNTPSSIVYGELGRMPVELLIKQRMINYWAKIISSKDMKINKILYRIMFNLHEQKQFEWPWLTSIKNILNNCGMGNIWIEHNFRNKKWLSQAIKLRLSDQYKQQWFNSMEESNSLRNYLLIKTQFGPESYMDTLPAKLARSMRKFRTNNHKLPIEANKYDGTPREDRKCQKCNLGDLGDEYHYLMRCTYYNDLRKKHIPKKFYHRPNVINYRKLMGSSNRNLLIRLAKFISEIMTTIN